MNIEQLERLLIDHNPHWRTFSPDSSLLRYKREVFDQLYTEITTQPLISIIFGPRRIGKSHLLLQIMQQLLQKKTTSAQQILYFPFTSQYNQDSFITTLLNLYLSKYAKKDKKIYIFFDEVQYIDYWQDQIKSYYDRHDVDIKFVLTGSISLFYKQKSKESLLGRFIKYRLSGLSFLEYLTFKNKPVRVYSEVDFTAYLDLFRSEFKSYLAYGQFPELVLSPHISPRQYLETLTDQLINVDVAYLHPTLDRPLLYNLIRTLAAETAQEMSIQKLAIGLDTKRQEIAILVKILEELFILGTCTNAFYRKMRAKLSASKKAYMLNTNMALALNGFDHSYLNDSYVFGHYVENYAYIRLSTRSLPRLEYYDDGKGEIDFVGGDTVWEVKSGQIKNEEIYREIARRLKKKLVLITESIYAPQAEVPKIPIYLL